MKDIVIAILFVLVVCLLVFSIIWVYHEYRYSPPFVDEAKYPVKGIDISRHNGRVDFRKVKESGMEFVFIKATEGEHHRDSLFSENIDAARMAGLATGAYHFFRFDREGVAQALNFLQAVGGRRPELGLVIDVEQAGNPDVPKEEVKRKLSSMVEYMNLLGYPVMIYTNLDGYYDYIADLMPGCPLWICRFKENPINAEWTFWQYDHHGRVEGVAGDVDLNVFNGSRKEWEEMISPARETQLRD